MQPVCSLAWWPTGDRTGDSDHSQTVRSRGAGRAGRGRCNEPGKRLIRSKDSRAAAANGRQLIAVLWQAMAEVEQLKAAKTQAEKNPIKAPMPPAQENERGQKARELRVCDICGSFISIRDNDQRLQDHFAGKLHIGERCCRVLSHTFKLVRV